MPLKSDPELGINSWLEDELYQQYLHDRSTVDESWKHLFETNGGEAALKAPTPGPQPPTPFRRPRPLAPNPQPLISSRSAAPPPASPRTCPRLSPSPSPPRSAPSPSRSWTRTAASSTSTAPSSATPRSPTPTSSDGPSSAPSRSSPRLNHAYAEKDGQPFRVTHSQINLGIAIDVAGKDGARSLMVPNIKNAGALNFQEYVTAFDDLVSRARASRLTPADFQGTTISLTNPGTVGTMSSNPRLMPGQGAIVAAGAIDYPAEYRGAADETRASSASPR